MLSDELIYSPRASLDGDRLQQADIGFVGLGRMGAGMAANLAADGHRVIAYVRRSEHMPALTAAGLAPTTEIADLFGCDVVISMLPDDETVRDIVFGQAEAAWKGSPPD